MERFKHDLALKIVKILDAILLMIPFALCWLLYYGERIAQPYYSKGNVVIIALFLFVYIALGKVYEGFLVSMNRISEMVYSQALACSAGYRRNPVYRDHPAVKKNAESVAGIVCVCRTDCSGSDLVLGGTSVVLFEVPSSDNSGCL